MQMLSGLSLAGLIDPSLKLSEDSSLAKQGPLYAITVKKKENSKKCLGHQH